MRIHDIKDKLVAFAYTASILLGSFLPTLSVQAVTVTWDGDTNALFSETTNWNPDGAVVNDDDLVFDNDTFDFGAITPNNDSALTSVTSITAQGSDIDDLAVTGSALSLGGDITNSASTAGFSTDINLTLTTDVALNGDVDISGTIDLNGNTLTVNGNSVLSGTISGSGNIAVGVSGNLTIAGLSSVDDVTVASGGSLTLTTDVTISGTSGIAGNVLLGGNTLTIDADKQISGVISGSGNLAYTGSILPELLGNNTFSGGVTVGSGVRLSIGHSNALGNTTGETTVISGGALRLSTDTAENITIGGGGLGGTGALIANGTGTFTRTLTGTVTLTADTTVYVPSDAILNVADLDDNSETYSLSSSVDSEGLLQIGGEAEQGETTIIPEGDEDPGQAMTVSSIDTLIVNGVRGAATVSGILMGTGTVGTLNVLSGGILAPGLSPGCLASGNLTLNSGSTFEVEIDGTTVCTEYDQMQVNGTVSLGGATLTTSFLSESFKLTAGDEFIIIDNDDADAVTGEFASLADGTVFTIADVSVRINYDGGDGNDVVLTVTEVPEGSPYSGFAMLIANPMVPLAATLTVLAAILGSYRYYLVREES